MSARPKPADDLTGAADSLRRLSRNGRTHPQVPEGDVEQVFALRWAVASEEMARAPLRLSLELQQQAQVYRANALAWREKAIGRRR